LVLRPETKARARALQILYACELSGEPIEVAASGLACLAGSSPRIIDQAATLAAAVLADIEELDRQAARAAENWRLNRIAVVERNILRLGVHELLKGQVPPKVAIDEAVRLAHWFGGAKSPAFINGVLDQVARTLGRL
jgi:transcription antitermination protein NusB